MSEDVYYPFEWWQFFSHRARLRRRQLHLSVAKLKQRVPYARFLYSTAFFWLVVNMAVWLFNWAIPDLILGRNGWIFFIYLGVSFAYITSVLLYAWVQGHWPDTVKWQIGHAYPVSVRSFKPGQIRDSIEIFDSDQPGAKKTRIDVELAIGGGVDDLPFPKDKGPVLIGKTVFRDEKGNRRAGRLQGRGYFVPCKPYFYVLGDMHNWRGVDWAGVIQDHFGGLVNDFTLVELGVDEIDPETWDPPADPVSIKRELYEAKQRIHQLEVDLGDYTMEDRIRKGGKESEDDL